MANELYTNLVQPGLTVTASLYIDGAIADSGISLQEIVGGTGLYVGDMPALDAGEYIVQFIVGGVVRSIGTITWDGTKEVTLLDVGSSSAGVGANPVTITVKDNNNNAVQAATISVRSGSLLVGTTTTDNTGVSNPILRLDDGTYDVSVTAGGYSGGGGSLVVSGITAHEFDLTVLAITPSVPPLVTGFFTATDNNGNPESGVKVSWRILHTPKTSTGLALYGDICSTVSGDDGTVSLTNLVAGSRYEACRENGKWFLFIAGSTTFPIPSVIGLI